MESMSFAEQSRSCFTCAICLESAYVDESITLGCEHRYCKACIKRHVEEEISKRLLVKCPLCKVEIDQNIVKYLVSSTQHQCFLDQAVQSWLPSGNEKWFYCPTVNCPFQAVISTETSRVKCQVCNKFTVFDQRRPENPAIQPQGPVNGKNDELFRRVVRERHWKACPHCGIMVEKTVGCDHIVCYSSICRGQREFCYMCGKAWENHGRSCSMLF